MARPRLSITWLGHSTFILTLPTGKRILVDPWLGNPSCPSEFAKPGAIAPIDLILLTHGHSDHIGDAITCQRATGAPLVAAYELAEYFSQKGLTNVHQMNIGGTTELAGVRISMTFSTHSSSTMENGMRVYLGPAAGYVLRAPDLPTVYISGDTGLFGDMKMIGEIYQPQIAFLPIRDLYTMGPDLAAIAAQWLNVRQVVPMHWGTFCALTGTPSVLKQLREPHNIEVL